MSTRCLFNARIPAANWQNLAASNFFFIGRSGTLYPMGSSGSQGTIIPPEDALIRGLDECLMFTEMVYNTGTQTGLVSGSIYTVSLNPNLPPNSGVWMGGTWITQLPLVSTSGQIFISLNLGNNTNPTPEGAPGVTVSPLVALALTASTFPTAAADIYVQVWGMALSGWDTRY